MRTDENYFIYNGVKSTDYGVWCSGTGTWGAPERDIDQIAVPGRNGDLQIDNGRFKNKDIPYDCFMLRGDCERNIDEFRAWLMTLSNGYYRLEDPYHPNEYRLARVKDFNPVMGLLNRTASFTLTFDCKPQRFYKDDPTEVTLGMYLQNNLVSTQWMDFDKLDRFVIESETNDTTRIYVDLLSVFKNPDSEVVHERVIQINGLGIDHNNILASIKSRNLNQYKSNGGMGGTFSHFKVRIYNIPLQKWLYVTYDGKQNTVNLLNNRLRILVENPSLYPAKPLIAVRSSKKSPYKITFSVFPKGKVSSDDYIDFEVSGLTQQRTVYFDFETMDAYYISGSKKVSVNHLVKIINANTEEVAAQWPEFRSGVEVFDLFDGYDTYDPSKKEVEPLVSVEKRLYTI